jgi:phosphoadenosine phosphosulfate reductase
MNRVDVNPLYAQGYRSLGCWPCTKIAQGADERAGRWIGTSKCGGECGIHTRPLVANRPVCEKSQI